MKKIAIFGILISIILISGAGCVKAPSEEVLKEALEKELEQDKTTEKFLEIKLEEKPEEEFIPCFPKVVKVEATYEYKSPLGYRIICPAENCFYTENEFSKYSKQIDQAMKVFLAKTNINLLEFYPQGIDIHMLNLEENKRSSVCDFLPEDEGDWETAWADADNGTICLNWYYLSKEGNIGKYMEGSVHYATVALLISLNASDSFNVGLVDMVSWVTSGDAGSFCDDEYFKFSQAYAQSEERGSIYRGYRLFNKLCNDGRFDAEQAMDFIVEVGRKCKSENKGSGTVEFGDIKCTLDKYLIGISEEELTQILKEYLFDESEKEYLDRIHKC